MIYLIQWKDHSEDGASWELENDFREFYLNFVVEDNDLIGKGKTIMD